MSEKEELRELLRAIWNMPRGGTQIAAVERVLRHVDQTGDRELAFDARMAATSAYCQGGEPAKGLVTFAWCLADYDGEPKPWHVRWRRTLMWHYKFTMTTVLERPEIPLTRVTALLDDMERRYVEYGAGNLRPVYKNRHRLALQLGDASAAEEFYERWVTARRGPLSDCVGCDAGSRVYYLGTVGRDREAIELGEATLAGGVNCTSQPHGIKNQLVWSYLRTGRGADAAEAHRRAYREHRKRIASLYGVGNAIVLCARTGNEHRGLEILLRHRHWLPDAPSPDDEMWFAASAGLLLRRLIELGRDRLAVGETTVSELHAEVSAQALAIAARFDARNGTSARTTAVKALLSAEPHCAQLDLSRPKRPLSRAT